MKKVILLAAAAAMLMTACESKQKAFVLTASELPAELNNSYAYIVEGEEKLDSVLITDGAFKYETTNLEADKISTMTLGNGGEMGSIPFIKESGEFKVIIDTEGEQSYSVVPVAEDATSLNAKLVEMNTKLREVAAPITAQMEEKYKLLINGSNLAPDSLNLIREEMNALNEQYAEQTGAVAQKYYDENKDNAIGLRAFNFINFKEEADFIAAYESASPLVKADERLTRTYEMYKAAQNTQVGAKYTDFTMEDGQGNSVKLSDYLNDGRYLLVDFWASWCPPCRAAMPHLAQLHKTHGAKVRVLSIGVEWRDETIEKNEAAKKELGMVWETAYDSKAAGPEAYGVSGIPTLLFISPDGEILVRTHSPEDVDAKIAELKL